MTNTDDQLFMTLDEFCAKLAERYTIENYFQDIRFVDCWYIPVLAA